MFRRVSYCFFSHILVISYRLDTLVNYLLGSAFSKDVEPFFADYFSVGSDMFRESVTSENMLLRNIFTYFSKSAPSRKAIGIGPPLFSLCSISARRRRRFLGYRQVPRFRDSDLNESLRSLEKKISKSINANSSNESYRDRVSEAVSVPARLKKPMPQNSVAHTLADLDLFFDIDEKCHISDTIDAASVDDPMKASIDLSKVDLSRLFS
jgi:hypothetical protein